MKPLLIPVILAGGAGSRLWPVSRVGHPKPFLKLPDGSTLIERAYKLAKRIADTVSSNGVGHVVTVTNKDYYFLCEEAFSKVGGVGQFLLEPLANNTAPAIAMTARCILEQYGNNASLLIMAADHLIEDEDGFLEIIKTLVSQPDATNSLVTFGITPVRAETGFGYIKKGGKSSYAYEVERFVEKPTLSTAKQYVESGEYLWNSGMFLFNTKTLINELKIHDPELFALSESCFFDSKDELKDIPKALVFNEESFTKMTNQSIDYALMEKSNNIKVVECDIGWNDIGAWNSLKKLVAPDGDGNRIIGEAIAIDSTKTFIHSESRMVAALGLDNIMIIDTKDALLVSRIDKAQDVKKITTLLASREHKSTFYHQTESRPWGSFTVLEDSVLFKIKRLEVSPFRKLSLQSHKYRNEHWVVVEGIATVTCGDAVSEIISNQSVYIQAGQVHRLENNTSSPLVVIEVQTGSYLGEDDIVRFDDIYGRGSA